MCVRLSLWGGAGEESCGVVDTGVEEGESRDAGLAGGGGGAGRGG